MAGIDEVARRAGVSTATVSRALRGVPGVAPGTSAAVRAVADELGYVPSWSASTLASGRTSTVAVLTPSVDRWYFARILGAVEDVLRREGYDALLVALDQQRADAGFAPAGLRGRADAVVVLSLPLPAAGLSGLQSVGLPLVFIGASVPDFASVRVDDVAVGRLATEHLLDHGHTAVAYVGGGPVGDAPFHTAVDRRAGWMAALRARGVEPQASYDVPGRFTATGGAAAARRLLALPEPPTAVVAASDEMALGVLAAAREVGVAVPGDLSLVGVDGHEVARAFGLTSVEQPVERMGGLAAQMVLAELAGRSAHRGEHVLLPVHLHSGTSTGRPRQPQPAVGRTAAETALTAAGPLSTLP